MVTQRACSLYRGVLAQFGQHVFRHKFARANASSALPASATSL
jgi:hypothetical protein